MLFAHGRINTAPMAAEQEQRLANADLLFGRVTGLGPKPGKLLFDYVRPTVDTGWTRYIAGMGGGSIARGCKELLDQSKADGLLIDTPFETLDPWGAIRLVDEIRDAISPRLCMPNFGDAWTWGGPTSAAKALAAITDWHLCEVWIDAQKYDIVRLASAMDVVERMLRNGKHIVLGVYDNGATKPQFARDVMKSWPDRVYWSYKTSPNDWSFYPAAVGVVLE